MLWNWTGTTEYGGLTLVVDWTGRAAAAAGTGVSVEDMVAVGTVFGARVSTGDIAAGGIF